MGIDRELFSSQIFTGIPEDFICNICRDVLKDPVGINGCDHIYCRDCITADENNSNSDGNMYGAHQHFPSNHPMFQYAGHKCPTCRTGYTGPFIKPNRMLMNIYKNLRLKCSWYSNGCRSIQTIESLDSHVAQCSFRNMVCRVCSHFVIPVKIGSEELCPECIKTDKSRVTQLNSTITKLQDEIIGYKATIDFLQTAPPLNPALMESSVPTASSLFGATGGFAWDLLGPHDNDSTCRADDEIEVLSVASPVTKGHPMFYRSKSGKLRKRTFPVSQSDPNFSLPLNLSKTEDDI